MAWETVIGIETHVQLSTKTKLFSRASTEFGKSPNTNVNLIDCGLPGVLPSVNKEAFYKAIRFGLAVGAKINRLLSLIVRIIFMQTYQKVTKLLKWICQLSWVEQ